MMWANISHCPRKMATHEHKNDSELSVINSGEGNSNGGFECLDSNSGKYCFVFPFLFVKTF